MIDAGHQEPDEASCFVLFRLATVLAQAEYSCAQGHDTGAIQPQFEVVEKVNSATKPIVCGVILLNIDQII